MASLSYHSQTNHLLQQYHVFLATTRDILIRGQTWQFDEDVAILNDNGDSGLSEGTIRKSLQVSTPKTKIGGKGEDQKEEIDTCAICYSEYEENKQIGKLQCGHLFHVECLISWLSRKNSCPMCRATALTV